MIKPGEIQKMAREVVVRDQQIEKDYILSWILQGIAAHQNLSESIVFKGGTALKKIYFEDYRFSEDLDFTLLDDLLSNEQIFAWFSDTFSFIQDEANIPLHIIEDNIHQDGGINFYISYIGPLGGMGGHKKVKIDISRSEKLVSVPVSQDVIITYSDQSPHRLLCYSLEEVLVEKLRSVMQRMQPRDMYDIWYLLEVHGMEVEFLISQFNEKCESKGINPSEFHDKLDKRLPQYKSRWNTSMADQIHDLHDFDQVVRELNRHLKSFSV